MHIDYNSHYEQMQKLKKEEHSQKRGYAFEQLIREILPWDFRPPIAAVGKSEQHDAFFSWMGRDFFVESKAKKKEIKTGSHDWEDFELKVRKRHGQAIGLFASLYAVSPGLFEAAERASYQGLSFVIIDDSIWKGLAEHRIPLPDYVNFVLASLKTKNSARPKKIAAVRDYFEDAQSSLTILLEALSPVSGRFLRRFKKDLHEQVYLDRLIDKAIDEQCRTLHPSKISIQKYDQTHKAMRNRQVDEQIAIIRDVSGAGKTTLSVQLSLNNFLSFVSVCRTASDPNVDGLLDDLRKVDANFGVRHLKVIDRSLLYVVDSLDEAEHIPDARRKIISLNRSIQPLNDAARREGLAAFPLVILYTVRDEHWRIWDSVFEGLHVRHHNRKFSKFSSAETVKALGKYCKAYGFRLNKPGEKLIQQLSSPFDLAVFSETFSHEGFLKVEEVFTKSVLTTFFLRKAENLSMRPMAGTSPDRVIHVAAALAKSVSIDGQADFGPEYAYRIFTELKLLHVDQYKSVLEVLISERIIERVDQSLQMKFRHYRFVEYLVALFYAHKMVSEGIDAALTEMVSISEKSRLISVISICDVFRQICHDKYPDHSPNVVSFFARSIPFLMKIAEKGRLGLARSEDSQIELLDMLEVGFASDNATLAWESYFIFFSKRNNLCDKKLVKIFLKTWELNGDRQDLWKLVKKISLAKILLNEEVFTRIMYSEFSAVWLSALDKVVEFSCFEEFVEIWNHFNCDRILERHAIHRPEQDWQRVHWVLPFLLVGRAYPLGMGEG